MRKMMMMMIWMVWWTPPESHKAGRCSPIGRHNIARVLIRNLWAGESLTCDVSSKGHVPTHWLRGRWPRRRVSKEGRTRRNRGTAPATTRSGSQAGVVIELETGQVEMGEAYVERWELVSICHPGASSYSREYKNRFESLMLTRCENANTTDGQSSNPLEYVVL